MAHMIPYITPFNLRSVDNSSDYHHGLLDPKIPY